MAVITNPYTGKKYADLDAQGIMNLAQQVVEQYFIGAAITSKYPSFERSISEYGGILGRVRFPAVTSIAVDPNTMTKIAPAYPNPDALYFCKWQRKRYPVEWDELDVQKVVNGELKFNEFIARAINAAVEGYQLDKNRDLKNAFMKQGTPSSTDDNAAIWVGADGTVSTAAQSFLGHLGHFEKLEDGVTFQEVYQVLQDISKDMLFDNSTYTDAFVCGAEISDLKIVVPHKFMSGANTAYLAQLAQLQKAEKLPEIVETDGCIYTANGKTYCVALIMDQDFMFHCERARMTLAGHDRDRGSFYNDLIVEDGIPVFPSMKAYAVIFQLPTQGTAGELVNA